MDSPRFLTLTVRSTDAPLGEQVRRLLHWFRDLRRTKPWKRYVRGGIYVVECTYSAKLKQWHPHLHVVIDGHYFPRDILLASWEATVGDHAGVHIRGNIDRAKVVTYICGYVSKGSDARKFGAEQFVHWAMETHGLRTLSCIGWLHNVRIEDVEEEPQKAGDWWFAFDADELAHRAASGCEAASKLLLRLKRRMDSDAIEETRKFAQQLRVLLRGELISHRRPPPKPPDPELF